MTAIFCQSNASKFAMLLKWARKSADDPFLRGYTFGFIAHDDECMNQEQRLTEWQVSYIENVMRARQRGISA